MADTKISAMTDGGTVQVTDKIPVVRSGANRSVVVGNAATKNTGTTTGTVAAGDDSRIVNALSESAADALYQPLNTNLTTYASVTPSATGQSIISGTLAQTKTLLAFDGTISVSVYNNGSVLTAVTLPDLIYIPYDATIVAAEIVADQIGSIVFDIWRDTYGNLPPTVADTIVASAKPTLSSAIKSQDTTLTGWSTSLTKGQYLRIKIDSVSTITYANLILKLQRNT